jgi:hypothetical protein
MLILFCMRGCGRIVRPAFPAPSDFRGQDVSQQNSRACGEIAELWLQECCCLKCEAVARMSEREIRGLRHDDSRM